MPCNRKEGMLTKTVSGAAGNIARSYKQTEFVLLVVMWPLNLKCVTTPNCGEEGKRLLQ